MKKLLVIILGLMSVSAVSLAQYRGHFEKERGGRGNHKNFLINKYQRTAMEHIAAGILNGNITANEAKRLLDMAEKIELKENRFMRNRRLSQREMNILRKDLNELDRMISRERRDRDRMPIDRTRF